MTVRASNHRAVILRVHVNMNASTETDHPSFELSLLERVAANISFQPLP